MWKFQTLLLFLVGKRVLIMTLWFHPTLLFFSAQRFITLPSGSSPGTSQPTGGTCPLSGHVGPELQPALDRETAASLAQHSLGFIPVLPRTTRKSAWALCGPLGFMSPSFYSHSQVLHLPVSSQMKFCSEVHLLQHSPFHRK